MARRQLAIVHIGTPKTGSTSIQKYLLENRGALTAHGACYPEAPGKRNHTALAAIGAGEDSTNNVVRRSGAAADPAALAGRLRRDLARELEALPAHVQTVLFSSEQLANRLRDQAAVERLQALLTPSFENIRILVYLRRQDEVAVSKYSTSLRAGGETDATLLPGPGDEGGLYDLAAILDRYAAVFGTDAIRPRLFDRGSLLNGDVVADFLAACGLDALRPDTRTARNPTLSAPVQELVRRFNERVETREVGDRPRIGPLLREERYWGRGRLPLRAEARAFYDRFAAGNERIRATWFPDRATLFPEDFSRYPAAADPAATADGAVLSAALDLLVDLGVRLRDTEVERQFLTGEAAAAAGRTAEARRHFSKVLRAERKHRGARRALAALDAADGGGAAGAPTFDVDDDVEGDAADGGPGAEAAARRTDRKARKPKPERAAQAGGAGKPGGRNQDERDAKRAARKAARVSAG